MSQSDRQDVTRAQLTQRAERWRRYQEWERAEMVRSASDFAQALAWMAEAWILAHQSDPEWASAQTWKEHALHVARIRSRLAVLDPA